MPNQDYCANHPQAWLFYPSSQPIACEAGRRILEESSLFIYSDTSPQLNTYLLLYLHKQVCSTTMFWLCYQDHINHCFLLSLSPINIALYNKPVSKLFKIKVAYLKRHMTITCRLFTQCLFKTIMSEFFNFKRAWSLFIYQINEKSLFKNFFPQNIQITCNIHILV